MSRPPIHTGSDATHTNFFFAHAPVQRSDQIYHINLLIYYNGHGAMEMINTAAILKDYVDECMDAGEHYETLCVCWMVNSINVTKFIVL